jgi:1-acyl-sn-glycerol-3-phosphate acyltransferase
MLFIRSVIFNLYFYFWTFGLAIIASPFYFAPQPIASKVGHVWAEGILIGLKYICNITYKIYGEKNLPEYPFIIASKHQSAWDTFILLKHLKAPAYILKKELMKIPLFGWYLKVMKMIPVDRKGGTNAIKKLQNDVYDRLSRKRPVVIFPEGTRTMPGQTIDYQPGIALVYKSLNTDIPVVPVALNSGKFWGKNSFIKKPGVIELHYLKPIAAGAKRKDFMKQLKDSIEKKSIEIS